MSDFQTIKVTEDNHAARLTLARSPLNVLNIAMLKEINTFLQGLIGRDDLCVLLIAGEGKAFSAGVDVPEHTGETAEEMIGTFHRMFRLLHKLPMPTVCAAHGGVFGGGMELAIFCDIILAADNLKIGVPEITLGVYPPPAIAHLAQIVGVKKAAELIYTGTVIDAAEALRIGLVNHVYPADGFAGEVDAYLQRFTRLSAFALGQTKKAFREAVMADFDRALDVVESIYLKELMSGDDPTEGLTAFIEKRKPVWTHR